MQLVDGGFALCQTTGGIKIDTDLGNIGPTVSWFNVPPFWISILWLSWLVMALIKILLLASAFSVRADQFVLLERYYSSDCSGVHEVFMGFPVDMCTLQGSNYKRFSMVDGRIFEYNFESNSRCEGNHSWPVQTEEINACTKHKSHGQSQRWTLWKNHSVKWSYFKSKDCQSDANSVAYYPVDHCYVHDSAQGPKSSSFMCENGEVALHYFDTQDCTGSSQSYRNAVPFNMCYSAQSAAFENNGCYVHDGSYGCGVWPAPDEEGRILSSTCTSTSDISIAGVCEASLILLVLAIGIHFWIN